MLYRKASATQAFLSALPRCCIQRNWLLLTEPTRSTFLLTTLPELSSNRLLIHQPPHQQRLPDRQHIQHRIVPAQRRRVAIEKEKKIAGVRYGSHFMPGVVVEVLCGERIVYASVVSAVISANKLR